MYADRTSPACLLLSGGLDSSYLLQHFLARGAQVFPVYLRCGFHWEAAELYWLRRFLRAVRSPRLLPLHLTALPLRSIYGEHWSFGGRSVLEIVAPFRTDTYRALYTVRFHDALYVLHAFQKKSTHGIATSRQDLELIRQRLAAAERDHRERQIS